MISTVAAPIIKMIDLAGVNLYPFEDTVAKDNVSQEEAIEQLISVAVDAPHAAKP